MRRSYGHVTKRIGMRLILLLRFDLPPRTLNRVRATLAITLPREPESLVPGDVMPGRQHRRAFSPIARCVVAIMLAACSGARSSAQDLPQVFDDDFSTDTRAAYAVASRAEWDQGLTLGKGGILERRIQAGCNALTGVDFAWPKQAPLRLRLYLEISNSWGAFVEWEQKRSAGGEWVREIRIVQLTESDSAFSFLGVTKEILLRSGRLAETAPARASFQISFRRGLLEVFPDGERARPLTAFIETRQERPIAVKLVAQSPDVRIHRLRMSAAPPPAQLTRQQRRELDRVIDLNAQVVNLWRSGRPREAIGLCEEAERIAIRLRGESSYERALSLGNKASQYLSLGNYREAIEALENVTAIQERLVGPRHPAYASCLHKQAMAHGEVGQFDTAESLFIRAAKIREVALGPTSTEFSRTLNGLALLYQELADYSRAIPLMKKVLEIQSQSVGKESADYATSLNNLAAMYGDLGDYRSAAPLFEQSASVRRRVLGPMHPLYATSLNNLAWLQSHLGNDGEAESYYDQSLAIRKQVQDELHPEYAINLTNLASTYVRQGRFEKARRFYERGIAAQRTLLGENNLAYTGSVIGLADVHMRTGEFDRARELIEEATTRRLHVVGKRHVAHASSLRTLARWHAVQEEFEPAARNLLAAAEIGRRHVEATAIVQSERQQKRAQATNRFYLDEILEPQIRSRLSAKVVVESIWSWKGAVTLRQQAYRRAGADPRTAKLFQELRDVSGRLSVVSHRAPAAALPSDSESVRELKQQRYEAWAAEFRKLSDDRENLESQIATTSEVFREATRRITVEEVAGSLPARSALVDFLVYDHRDYSETTAGIPPRQARVLASIIRPDASAALVDLGAAEPITASINQFRSAFVAGKRSKPEETRAAADWLRESVWAPLESHLGNCETVLISPDGVLGLLPFAALPGRAAGRYLIEDYGLVSVPMAGLLPRLRAKRNAMGSLMVVGDIKYAAGDSSEADDSTPVLASALRSGPSGKWKSLPGFRNEMKLVTELFHQRFGTDADALLLTGSNATEHAFLQQATRHNCLHVVTHGFFRDTASAAASPGNENIVSTWQPGLLSGLVMAGANSSDAEDSRDGILSASEIEGAPLTNVDLVVLSACETGLGAASRSEGLSGLQRAFHVSGVRTCIASLWEVDDRATQELMREFYTNLWLRGQTRLKAFRNAQLHVLKNPVLSDGTQLRGDPVRTRKPVANVEPRGNRRAGPQYWAAFVLSEAWE